MSFTKTSQKFGQWTDTRANTVYGLGFSSEQELNKVSFIKYLCLYFIVLMSKKKNVISSYISSKKLKKKPDNRQPMDHSKFNSLT